MKDKILFGLFVLLALSTGLTLGGVGKGNSTAPVPAIPETASAEQVLASVNEVLAPFLADYQQRYDALNTEKSKLQSEIDTANQQLAAVQASGDTVATLKSQVSQQQSEIGNLSASLQNAVNDSASWQQKFLQSQQSVTDAQNLLASSQDAYNRLQAKLQAVDAHTSDTVNGFTADEKATFYKVWDKWWDLVVVGAD